MTKKHPTDARDLINDEFGDEMVDFMDQISGSEYTKLFNMITLLNEPGKSGALVAFSFAQIFPIDVTDGKIKLDEEFYKHDKRTQFEELEIVLGSFIGLYNTLERIRSALKEFIDPAVELYKELDED